MPEFKELFGKFFVGEPVTDANYAELDAVLAATGAKISEHWRVPKPAAKDPRRTAS